MPAFSSGFWNSTAKSRNSTDKKTRQKIQAMASFAPTTKRGINASMLSPNTKKDSFDEMGSTYVSPDASMKINSKGVRGNDGCYLDTVSPQELIVKEELGRGASAVRPLFFNNNNTC